MVFHMLRDMLANQICHAWNNIREQFQLTQTTEDLDVILLRVRCLQQDHLTQVRNVNTSTR
ncbi:hypothetical protein D3C75_780600 [compost metagenome]